MINTLKKIATTSILATLFFVSESCYNSEEKSTIKSETNVNSIQEEATSFDSINKKNKNELIQIYNADNNWDSAYYYTVFLQEKLENNLQPILFSGRIKDITKVDTTYLLFILNKTYSTNIIAKATVSKSLFERIKKEIKDKNSLVKGHFILRDLKARSIPSTLISESESSSSIDDVYTDVYINQLIKVVEIKASLIDFYLDKN